MGRMNEADIPHEDTPPNMIISDQDSIPFRSDSPVIKLNEKSVDIPDKETNVSLQTVPCSKCDRSFTLERIQKHEEICTSIKPRKVYDIVKMRVKGTESEKLVKEGNTKLPTLFCLIHTSYNLRKIRLSKIHF